MEVAPKIFPHPLDHFTTMIRFHIPSWTISPQWKDLRPPFPLSWCPLYYLSLNVSYCLDEDVGFCNVVVLGGSALPQHQAGTGGHFVALNMNRRTFCCLEPEQWDIMLPWIGTVGHFVVINMNRGHFDVLNRNGGHFVVLNRNRGTFCCFEQERGTFYCLEQEQWEILLSWTGTGGHFDALNRNRGKFCCLEQEQGEILLFWTGTGGHFVVMNRIRGTFCCLEPEQWDT